MVLNLLFHGRRSVSAGGAYRIRTCGTWVKSPHIHPLLPAETHPYLSSATRLRRSCVARHWDVGIVLGTDGAPFSRLRTGGEVSAALLSQRFLDDEPESPSLEICTYSCSEGGGPLLTASMKTAPGSAR
jgi:hypothetical protein